jgi:hypothetical protein
MNILYFRFANSFLEPIWNRNYVASVQITLSEDFGVQGPRCVLRDRRVSARCRSESPLPDRRAAGDGAAVLSGLRAPCTTRRRRFFKAMRPLKRSVIWCAASTLATARSRTWPRTPMSRPFAHCGCSSTRGAGNGVPWYLRSGKCLAQTATEVLVELKPPPQRAVRGLGAGKTGRGQLSAIPPLAAIRDRAGRAREAQGQGVCRRPEGTLPARRGGRRRDALRAAPGRCHGRRRSTLHPRGRRRGRVGRGGSGAQASFPVHPLPQRGSWGPKRHGRAALID